MGQQAAEKTNILYVVFVNYFSRDCTFAWERCIKIFVIFSDFLLEPNTISDKVAPLMRLYKQPSEYNEQNY